MINYSKFPNMNIAISQKPLEHELVSCLASSTQYTQYVSFCIIKSK